MSKSVKRIIGVVAAIAVPFAAPAIASSIGLSTAIATATGSAAVGATLGSAVTGAALGAGTAALTGQDVGKGALFGAIGGGIGGYTGAPTGTGAAGLQEVAIQSPRYAASYGGGVYPLSGAAVTPAAFTPGLAGAQMAGAGTYGSTTAAAAAAPSFGARLSQAFSNVGSEIANRFTDPKNLADLTLRAAGQLAGSALAGSGLSPEEQRLLAAQASDLEELKRTNQELYNLKLEQAKAILGEAARDYGFEEEARAKVRGAGLTSSALRGLTGERRATEKIRQERARAEEAATGRTRGELAGFQTRMAARQTALGLIPSPPQASTMEARSGLLNLYGTREARRQAQAGQIGDWFGSLTGQRKAGLYGTETIEDRLRRLEEQQRGS